MLSQHQRRPMVVMEDVVKTFGAAMAIDSLSLTVGTGEFLTLLGPSGSGKTTCLRIIAGMIRPDSGRLNLAGRDISATPMHKRNIGMVFQNYSLFPHLTVAENVAYPLRVRARPAAEIARKVGEALDMIRLPHLAARRPDQLSGGQQQRVALARALAFDPDVLLLDEPLSALDRVLREDMQLELRRIHRETGKTMICVTHDRSEALTMADRIIVMRAGQIVQDDTPQAIYQRSNSRFVAEFLGETNTIPLTIESDADGLCGRDVAGRIVRLPSATSGMDTAGPDVDWVLRVENVRLTPLRAGSAAWRGTVSEIVFLGDAVRVTVDVAPHRITARLPASAASGIEAGADVEVAFDTTATMIFPKDTQSR